jgi:hypothetical protein
VISSRNLIASILSLFAFHGSVSATSIVAKIEAGRIILAADSRASGGEGRGAGSNDTTCKILPFSDGAAFAMSGVPGLSYKDGDPKPKLDSFSDGKDAYVEKAGNLLEASSEWGRRSVRVWGPYFSHQVQESKELLRTNGPDVATSVFAGFFRSPDRPRVVIGSVRVDLKKLPLGQPRFVQQILLPQAEPISSNPYTNELIAGQTPRAREANSEWLQQARSIKPVDRDRKYLEFLIQTTAKYDPHVDTIVNVLEIRLNKKPHWLQNPTCPANESVVFLPQ